MPTRIHLRDLALFVLAATFGWWAHGRSQSVHAESDLSFQYGGAGPDGQVTLYSPSTRTLFIYPSIGRAGSSHINCLYKVHVDKVGAPLDRENCANGSLLP